MGAPIDGHLPISVIVPLYRGQKYLPQLKSSLLDQGAAEVIFVIDDESAPTEIQSSLRGLPGRQVIATRGRIGTAGARNLGARAASQPWITFLDQDDWWDPGFLASIFDPQTEVVGYDNHLWRENNGNRLALSETVFERCGWQHPRVGKPNAALLLAGFPMLKLLLMRETFIATGGYRQIYAVEDFDLVWRLVAMGATINLSRSPGGNYLLHSDSTTSLVHTDRAAYERAQRSWMTIWLDMARAKGLPPRLRVACFLRAISTRGRAQGRRVRNAFVRA